MTNRRCSDSSADSGDSCGGRRLASALTTAPTRSRVAPAARAAASALLRPVETSVAGSRTLSTSALERQAGGGRRAARHPVVALELLALGAGVEQHLAEVDGLDAVDEDLVALREQRDPALGEALDEVDLPERAVHVEGPAHDPADQLAQLLHGAGARQAGAPYVEGQVEAVVVDPDRVGQPAGHLLQPLAVAGHERDPVGDQRGQVGVVEAVPARLEDLQRRVVHGAGGGVRGQEGEVARPQSLAHAPPHVVVGHRGRWLSSCPAWDSDREAVRAGRVPCSGGVIVVPRRRTRVATTAAAAIALAALTLSSCASAEDAEPDDAATATRAPPTAVPRSSTHQRARPAWSSTSPSTATA